MTETTMKSALLQKYTNRFYFTDKNGKMTKSYPTGKFLFGKHQIKICSNKEILFSCFIWYVI